MNGIPLTSAGLCADCETLYNITHHKACPSCAGTAYLVVHKILNRVPEENYPLIALEVAYGQQTS